jgi:hypothetical protein
MGPVQAGMNLRNQTLTNQTLANQKILGGRVGMNLDYIGEVDRLRC